MYFVAVVFCLVSAYFVLSVLYSLFFAGKFPTFTRAFIGSVIVILITSIVIILFVLNIPEPLSNRIQHAFLGGFTAFLICFLVEKDNKLSLTKFQFYVFSALIVTALGVTNEIAEFVVQEYVPVLHFVFSATVLDTWQDLASNTIGLLIAAACFVPFVHNKQSVLLKRN